MFKVIYDRNNIESIMLFRLVTGRDGRLGDRPISKIKKGHRERYHTYYTHMFNLVMKR